MYNSAADAQQDPLGEAGQTIDRRLQLIDPTARRHIRQQATTVELEYEGRFESLSLNEVETAGGRSWWILSDLDDHMREGVVSNDHVMGVGGATRSLIHAIPTRKVDRALDLGTGNGIVALHLSRFARRVIATDVSPRALWIASMNLRLNDVNNVELRLGDLFEPVGEETFDLIASNPPFVIEPARDGAVQYRASGEAGDGLLRRLIEQAAHRMRMGGALVCLANWEQHDGEIAWLERQAPEGTSAWVIERGSQAPSEYAAMWLRDGGLLEGDPSYRAQRDAWVEDFETRQVSAVTFGYVQLRRATTSVFRYEAVAGTLDRTFGEAWADAFDGLLLVHPLTDDELLQMHLERLSDVEEIRVLTPGTEDIRSISLVRRGGIERVIIVNTLEAAVVGACDGELSLLQIADALATLLELDVETCRAHVARVAREFIACGMLRPATSDTLERS